MFRYPFSKAIRRITQHIPLKGYRPTALFTVVGLVASACLIDTTADINSQQTTTEETQANPTATSGAEHESCEQVGRLQVEGVRTLETIPDFSTDEARTSVAEVLRTVNGCLVVDYVALDGRSIGEVRTLIEQITAVDAIGYPPDEPRLIEPDDHVPGEGRQVPPADRFLQIDAGPWDTCGIRIDHTVACWGESLKYDIPTGAFVEVAVGGVIACVRDANSAMQCWGARAGGDATILTDAPSSRLTQMSVGRHHACGILLQGTIECWGEKAGKLVSPDGIFTHVSVGGYYSCGLRIEGDLECWGTPFGYALPSTEFAEVATGGARACGLTLENGVECWSFSPAVREMLPPSGRFTTLKMDSQGGYACGLGLNGEAACWTSIDLPQDHPLNAPTSIFVDIAVGIDHACGLRPDGSVMCWGAD